MVGILTDRIFNEGFLCPMYIILSLIGGVKYFSVLNIQKNFTVPNTQNHNRYECDQIKNSPTPTKAQTYISKNISMNFNEVKLEYEKYEYDPIIYYHTTSYNKPSFSEGHYTRIIRKMLLYIFQGCFTVKKALRR